jgi:toxin ParE1/3/4
VRIVWAQTARRDIKHLHAYVQEHDPAAADRLAATILESVESLVRFPARGRPGRLPGTRELVIAGTPYLVPYMVEGDVLVVLAVLHGARQWPPE